MFRRFCEYLFFGVCLIGINQLIAADYYVSTTGNDAYNGLNSSAAFRTLQRAADLVMAGDVVHVAAGDYQGFYLTASGTAMSPIRFSGGPGVKISSANQVTPDGINLEGASFVVIDHFEVFGVVRAGIRIVLAEHVVVRNCHTHHNGRWGIFTGFTDDLLLENNECAYSGAEHGIYVSNSSDRSIIRYNLVHHNVASGIQINADESQGGDGISTAAQIYNNVIWENGTAGGAALNLDGAQNALIYNNLLYENHATGIALFDGDAAGPSSNAQIYHNTIVQASNARWCILALGGSSGAQIINNIIINQHAFRGALNIDASSLVGLVSDYNLLTPRITLNDGSSVLTLMAWQAQSHDQHSIAGTNLAAIFVNPANKDYHLTAQSPAITKGQNGLGITQDLEGNSRSSVGQVDIGAYVFNAALPVQLISFTGDAHPHYNILIWEVALVFDFSHYEVQRSIDAIHFITIGSIEGQQQSASLNYSFQDLAFKRGLNYYRLKMVDNDGGITYSPIISVVNQAASEWLYPNPFIQTLHTRAPECMPYRITSLHGHRMFQGQMCQSMDFSYLPQGIYLFEYKDGAETRTVRLVKLANP